MGQCTRAFNPLLGPVMQELNKQAIYIFPLSFGLLQSTYRPLIKSAVKVSCTITVPYVSE